MLVPRGSGLLPVREISVRARRSVPFRVKRDAIEAPVIFGSVPFRAKAGRDRGSNCLECLSHHLICPDQSESAKRSAATVLWICPRSKRNRVAIPAAIRETCLIKYMAAVIPGLVHVFGLRGARDHVL